MHAHKMVKNSWKSTYIWELYKKWVLREVIVRDEGGDARGKISKLVNCVRCLIIALEAVHSCLRLNFVDRIRLREGITKMRPNQLQSIERIKSHCALGLEWRQSGKIEEHTTISLEYKGPIRMQTFCADSKFLFSICCPPKNGNNLTIQVSSL